MMDCLDIAALVSFYDAHMGNAPEDVASMAPTGCMDEGRAGDSSDDTGRPDTARQTERLGRLGSFASPQTTHSSPS